MKLSNITSLSNFAFSGKIILKTTQIQDTCTSDATKSCFLRKGTKSSIILCFKQEGISVNGELKLVFPLNYVDFVKPIGINLF